jgi:hypothetical protein
LEVLAHRRWKSAASDLDHSRCLRAYFRRRTDTPAEFYAKRYAVQFP